MMEWIRDHLIEIVATVIGWAATAGYMVWKLSAIAEQSRANGKNMESLAQDFKDHENAFDMHRGDGSVHTTFEQRQAINGRLDRIETQISAGHAAIEAKIDRWADRILKK